jgi:hypothetical protein
MSPASSFRPRGFEGFYPAGPSQPSLRDLWYLQFPAKHDDHSFFMSEGVMSLKNPTSGGCWQLLSCGVKGSPPTIAPRRRGSTPMSQTCNYWRASYEKCHPHELDLRLCSSFHWRRKKAHVRYRRTADHGNTPCPARSITTPGYTAI